jgi:hypothetical protein
MILSPCLDDKYEYISSWNGMYLAVFLSPQSVANNFYLLETEKFSSLVVIRCKQCLLYMKLS